jgi:hypothetical protein
MTKFGECIRKENESVELSGRWRCDVWRRAGRGREEDEKEEEERRTSAREDQKEAEKKRASDGARGGGWAEAGGRKGEGL